MITRNELLNYLRNRSRPVSCSISPVRSGHVLVSCGACSVTIPMDEPLTLTTINQIERRLVPCLGDNWMP